ncbi:MAG: hypothetical protein ABIR92_10595 [Gemmatimonadaceae bacterium]
MKARLIGAVLLAACGTSVEPIGGDIYVVETIAGVSLPAAYSVTPGAFRIHADTLGFGADGRGERRTVYDSFQGTKRSEQTFFSHTRVGERVEITFDCADTASCFAPPHFAGTVSGTTLTLSESKIARVPFVLRRLFPPE